FNIDYQLGLRVEYTYRVIDFEQKDTMQTFSIDRPDFFPTIHLSKDLNNDQQIMASYSRRINRPRGWSLEPFTSYRDKYTMRKGNPDLQPEYISSYELAYQKRRGNSFIAIEGFYRITKGVITRAPLRESENTNVETMTFLNLDNDYALGAEFMINHDLTKWFKLNASTNLYHYRVKGDVGEGDKVKESFNWDGRISTTFVITPYTRAQVNGFYRGPSATVQGMRRGFWASDLAIKQEFFKRSLALTLQIRDVFGSMKFEFENEYSDSYFHGKFRREPTIFMLSLSYKINNYNKKQRNGDLGEDVNGAGEFEGGEF
ncbi:MAG: TonB-dependent receptor family protein, partial [Bacteroidales bacterium]|nr:TonB-dependent receptor family protein [Bacteroidales bacterium]